MTAHRDRLYDVAAEYGHCEGGTMRVQLLAMALWVGCAPPEHQNAAELRDVPRATAEGAALARKESLKRKIRWVRELDGMIAAVEEIAATCYDAEARLRAELFLDWARQVRTSGEYEAVPKVRAMKDELLPKLSDCAGK